jgi:exodeoxyribonuclease V beta subunit
VLDWKSDRLDTFDAPGVQACMEDRHYTLQAQVYCHALDKYLRGLLRDDYDPEQNLGGAVYVFLRSFSGPPTADACHTWVRAADPGKDSEFTAEQLRNLVWRNSK